MKAFSNPLGTSRRQLKTSAIAGSQAQDELLAAKASLVYVRLVPVDSASIDARAAFLT